MFTIRVHINWMPRSSSTLILVEFRSWMQLGIQIYAPKLRRLICSIFLVQTFNQVHVLLGQLKVENLKILFQSLRFWWLWNDNRVTLDAPSKNNLGHRSFVFGSQSLSQEKKIIKLVINQSHIRKFCIQLVMTTDEEIIHLRINLLWKLGHPNMKLNQTIQCLPQHLLEGCEL